MVSLQSQTVYDGAVQMQICDGSNFFYFTDMSDEPAEIEGWSRQQVLGCGAFGVVTLWKNTETGLKIGKINLSKCTFLRY
jgi:hypothetical protein